jgi:hypothetical protein
MSFVESILAALACMALLVGCATVPPDENWQNKQSMALRDALITLDDRVDYVEAGRLATEAVDRSLELAQQYRAVRPAWVHNNLVNAGLRERGLCYQWANDLFADLHTLKSTTLTLHLAVARMDTRREHNALIITAAGRPFSQGLVLDAWRGSGRLWWGPANTDRYPWEPLPPERVNPSLKQFVTQ